LNVGARSLREIHAQIVRLSGLRRQSVMVLKKPSCMSGLNDIGPEAVYSSAPIPSWTVKPL
jgi:hypothetical protein